MEDPIVLVALIGIIPGVLAAITPFFIHVRNDKKLKKVLSSIDEKITTNHGKNLGEHIEHITEKLEKMSKQLDSLWQMYDTVGSARFSAYLNISTEAIIIYDAEGKIQSANIKACEIYCLSYKDMIDGKWYDSISEDDRDLFYREYISAIESGRSFSLKYKITCNEHDPKLVISKGHPIYGHHGDIIGYLSVIEPV